MNENMQTKIHQILDTFYFYGIDNYKFIGALNEFIDACNCENNIFDDAFHATLDSLRPYGHHNVVLRAYYSASADDWQTSVYVAN